MVDALGPARCWGRDLKGKVALTRAEKAGRDSCGRMCRSEATLEVGC